MGGSGDIQHFERAPTYKHCRQRGLRVGGPVGRMSPVPRFAADFPPVGGNGATAGASLPTTGGSGAMTGGRFPTTGARLPTIGGSLPTAGGSVPATGPRVAGQSAVLGIEADTSVCNACGVVGLRMARLPGCASRPWALVWNRVAVRGTSLQFGRRTVAARIPAYINAVPSRVITPPKASSLSDAVPNGLAYAAV